MHDVTRLSEKDHKSLTVDAADRPRIRQSDSLFQRRLVSTIANRNNGLVVPPPPALSSCGVTTLTVAEMLLLDGSASTSADERLNDTFFIPIVMAVVVMFSVELD